MSDNRNENRETIADIVADIRERTYNATRHGERMTDNYAVSELLKSIASHIEAVWKRERAKVEADALSIGGIVEAARHKPVGNAAAIREALEAARDLLLPQCNGGTAFAKACGETVNKIMDALAKPPRNCDLNLSEKSLWDKFEDYMNDCGLPFYSEPSGEDAFGWLLAQAEKRRGE